MAVTNQLEIDIKAKSQKATDSLDALISKLNEVNTALNSLNTAKITQMSSSIKGLKGVHIKTSNGGGTGGIVKENDRAKSSFERLLNSVTNADKGFRGLRGTMLKLSATWGMFYASMYPFIRLFQFMGKEVEHSMDYVETFNYFKVTMNKIGHDAGEEFTDSFLSQIKSLDKKMTGFKIGKNGELIDADVKNLGIDPNIMMQFQAQIGAVTNSVGLLGKTSVVTQKAMSMLSADLSSLKNEDLQSVMKNLQSGLIGQSRALYKYGIDITQATLKQYAYEHGITKSVSAMTQSEKLQLRLLAILDQSKVAWGDQANSIMTVANQYRIMKQQISNLGRTIGNLFLPIVKTVLPYLNAFIISMRRILELFGMKVYGGDWQKDLMEGVSEGNFSGLEESIEDTEDALDGATKSAKKFKQATMGFDELNIINPQTSSGSGSGKGGGGGFDLSGDIEDAYKEYEDAWSKAFDNMQNKTQQLVEKFMKYVEDRNWFGLGDWMGSSLTNVLKKVDWERTYQGARNFGTGLAQFLNGLISPELFYQFGRTVASSLNTALYFTLNLGKEFDFKNFGESIGNGINGFFQNYDFKALADTLNTWVDGFEEAFGSAIDTISWKDVFKGLYDFVSNLEIDTVGAIVGVLTIKKIGKIAIGKAIGDLVASKIGSLLSKFTLTGMLRWIIEHAPQMLAGTPAFDVIAGEMIAQIDNALTRLFPLLSKAIGEGLLGAVVGALSGLWSGLVAGFEGGGLAGGIIGAIVGSLNAINPNIFKWDWTEEWVDKAIDSFKKIAKTKWYNFVEIGGYIFEGIIEGFIAAFSFITEPISRFFIELGKALADVFGIHSPAKNMMPYGEFILLGILEGFRQRFADWNKAIQEWFDNHVKPWFTKEKWTDIGKGIKTGLATSWGNFVAWWKDTGIYKWYAEHVAPLFAEDKWTFDGIAKGLKKSFTTALNGIKQLWNDFADWINENLSWDIPSVDIGDKTIGGYHIQLGKLPKFNIPQYAIGGFPEDGLFMANHNELVGQFSNGQTAVANNEQIIEGIRSGVATAVAQTLAPYLREIADNTGNTATNTDAIARKPVQSLSDRDIARANNRGMRSMGLQLRTS